MKRICLCLFLTATLLAPGILYYAPKCHSLTRQADGVSPPPPPPPWPTVIQVLPA